MTARDLPQSSASTLLASLSAQDRAELLAELKRSLGEPKPSRWLTNLALATDSYKASHYLQYPPGTTGLHAYIESRGGEFSHTLFFGLQMILKDYLAIPITHADVDEARDFWALHGEPFNEAGFRYIVDTHQGYFPVRINALPEGVAAPTGTPLMTIESTDPQAFWCVSYLETLLLQVWYPITVATQSWTIRSLIKRYLVATSDTPEAGLAFKLHDFGYRGVSSPESAARGALAHLVSFRGTDTVAGILAGRQFYREPMAGFSIPAAEHSTITSWGKAGEVDAYRNMLKQFAKPGALVAVVSDSYDLFNALENHWGTTLKQEIIDSGATVVIRPDSGDPASIVLKTLGILDAKFGSDLNSKGFRVLRHVRVIHGDGVNLRAIRDILAAMKINGYSAENVAFGMGGALLQGLNRDTCKFAMKTSAALIEGEWRDVFKDPVTDPGKRSKAGRLTAWRNDTTGEWLTTPVHNGWSDTGREPLAGPGWTQMLVPVWDTGRLLADHTLGEVRARADAVDAPLDRGFVGW
ncbi:nicotinate phosphoribosyltransferase [Piscinibacterium candidicorallinum]|uniref:Nicotinamide phosphoribosyltransferase n=1 Tax=Piscinibacterium candidicorallinum TaxID=1793872 RepID=A0ABV7H359_9BURK